LQYFEFTEGGKLVDHRQEFVFVGGFLAAILKLHFIGQAAHDHIDHDPHQRLQPRFVGWMLMM
jgi:hypothetical protein